MSNMGWQCPYCKACFAPFVQKCDNCTGTTTTADPLSPWVNPWGIVPWDSCTCYMFTTDTYCPVHGYKGYKGSDWYTTTGSTDTFGPMTFDPMDAWGGQTIEPANLEELQGYDYGEDDYDEDDEVDCACCEMDDLDDECSYCVEDCECNDKEPN